MKGLCIYLFLFLLCSLNVAQAQLHDNTWVLGYAGNGPQYGNSFLTFTEGSLFIDSIPAAAPFQDNNASFSTFEGKFFAHFNGNHIRDKSYLGMKNGTYFNEEVIQGYYYMSDDDTPQGSMFLPYPGHTDSVILLYLSDQILEYPGNIDLVCSDLSYAVVSMSGNNGLGSVVERTKSFIHDTIQYGRLNTVKHANGRDWWILVNERNTQRFYNVLLDPQGLHLWGSQAVETSIRDGFGMSKFSPDGSKYVVYNGYQFGPNGSFLDIFDFDRCTGLLSNQRQYIMEGEYGGIAISANSRYLYQALGDTVFQYDLASADIWSTRTVVALYDGFKDPFPVKFYQFQLAPDHKIYATATNSTQYLHVIHTPDEAGALCDFRQHGIKLLKYNYASLPNHPNYRLGPLDGSPCDSLGLNNWPKAWYRYQKDTLDPLAVAFHDLSYYEPATWSWDFGDGSAGSLDRHPQHTYDSAGTYEVCLTVSNVNGSHTHCKTLYLGVSASTDPLLQSQIIVAPNPFQDRLSVALSAQLRSPVLRLYDMTGRLVRAEGMVLGLNEIETGGLAAGLYFWQLRAGSPSLGGGRGELVKSGKIVKVE